MRFIAVAAVLLVGLAALAWAGAVEDFNAANAADDRGEYDEAIRLFSRAIESGELSRRGVECCFGPTNGGTRFSRKGVT